MRFIDLAIQQKRIREKIETNINAVLDHGQYIMGPEIKALEKRLADYVGVKHAIGCASGTDALLMALMAKQAGPGDAIFTTPFTFIATAEVISLLGATPVFVDIDSETYNLDPEQLDRAITALKTGDPGIYPLPAVKSHAPLNPKGIIGVDIFGLPADYGRIEKIAEDSNLFVIEDAAQSFGADLDGKKACSFGDIACTSFFPAKPLGCYGDGGMCFTDDDQLANIMESVRIHGQGDHKYDNVRVGINGRLDSLQAAILMAKFDIFQEEIDLRQEVANRYNELLEAKSGVKTPIIPAGATSAWAQYSVLARDESHRTDLQNKLIDADIPTAIYYPQPLHLQTAFSSSGYQQGAFPISESFSQRIFSLPMHPYLTEEDLKKIAEVISR